jgi:hypothetical protein
VAASFKCVGLAIAKALFEIRYRAFYSALPIVFDCL